MRNAARESEVIRNPSRGALQDDPTRSTDVPKGCDDEILPVDENNAFGGIDSLHVRYDDGGSGGEDNEDAVAAGNQEGTLEPVIEGQGIASADIDTQAKDEAEERIVAAEAAERQNSGPEYIDDFDSVAGTAEDIGRPGTVKIQHRSCCILISSVSLPLSFGFSYEPHPIPS